MTTGYQFQSRCVVTEADLIEVVGNTFPVVTGSNTFQVLQDYKAAIVVTYPYSDAALVRVGLYVYPSSTGTSVPNPAYQYLFFYAPACTVEDFQPDDSGAAVLAQDAATIAALNETVAGLNAVVAGQSATLAETQTGLQSLLNAAAEDFDPIFAGAVFGFFYCTVFVFYSISKGIGAVLASVKGGR